MTVLSPERRKELEQACVRGRRAAEAASRAAIGTLGVLDESPAVHLSQEERDLRRALRAKRDQLGDQGGQIELLVSECAYEQWHRLLFARFLAENNLLIHPQFGVQVTLAECDELAADLGEPDSWAVAGRFAAEILPGIFRLDDPCVRLRLAAEGRLALEQIVESISADTFEADDALGWVYQHWQRERKDEVNAAERKIGGADLAPVTQLFTENYMVRFLLENSLGAWWASRHPDSPLLRDWPATGGFEGWPELVADVTVMDPCSGSGHFLVEAFGMLWRMRAEEESLAPVAAQDAVLRDNLFGLELDPRCVQIAMFAVAMAAWKAGGRWRELPVPNVACSGIAAKAGLREWTALAGGDTRLEAALGRLHLLFRDADTLGSLIDPKSTAESSGSAGPQTSLDDVAWDDVAPLVHAASAVDDPAAEVLGSDAGGVARAATLLSRRYTLVTTNVPYLEARSQSGLLRDYLSKRFQIARYDLATAFISRCAELATTDGSVAVVSPQNWLLLKSYDRFRRHLLDKTTWNVVSWLGSGAFGAISGEVVNVSLTVVTTAPVSPLHEVVGCDVSDAPFREKASRLRTDELLRVEQAALAEMPDARFSFAGPGAGQLLEQYADGLAGIMTGDSVRFVRYFWEVPLSEASWQYFQSTVASTQPYGGRESVIRWDGGQGGQFFQFHRENRARLHDTHQRGNNAWGRMGIAVRSIGTLPVTLYTGERFDNNVAVVLPHREEDLLALWCYLTSSEYSENVRKLDRKMNVTNATLVKVPFDIDHWRAIAAAAGPLPKPHSDDPTQWLFEGQVDSTTEPLQVAVARLLGYRWPEQANRDRLDSLADADGIVCLPSVLGERTAADRLQELLARAFGGTWSPARAAELLAASGSKKAELGAWLRDEFFRAHCQVFKNRPFIWHVWDGRKDGFGALVNQHRLDRPALERLTYTYLGDWIERQAAGGREDVIGADERLVAARELQRSLELILAGDPPFDIYVRWKSVAEQALGWEPDIDDGVRLNVRPFVQAAALRAKFNVNWEKDRGKDADGSERRNDLHLTNGQKQAARDAGVGA
jgi:hypothetical protein